MKIHYTLCPIDYKAHLYEVSVSFVPGNESEVQLRLPTWIPGSYMIREFSKNITHIHARQDEKLIGIHKIDKSTWHVFGFVNDGTEVNVTYQVYAWDLSVRTAHLDEHHGFFNGTSVFLEVLGQPHSQLTLHITASDNHTQHWQVASGLKRQFDWNPHQDQLPRIGLQGLRYRANSYDELIDHPFEMGELHHTVFDAWGTPHVLVSFGAFTDFDLERLSKDLTPVCEYQIRLFEPETKQAPFEEYWFLIHASDNAYGGLEHRNSTALLCSRKDLPYMGMSEGNADYRSFVGLCSHEYFHSWNIKRIKPASFVPYDLTQENYTRLLWLFEGFTSYYDDLCLVKSRVITESQYLELLGKTIASVLKNQGRHIQTVADSSFDAWTKYYRQDENAQNSIVSYYTKGSLVALCLDILIRKQTLGEKTLDDVMRYLWTHYGKTGVGLPEGKLATCIHQSTGVDVHHDLEQFAYSTLDLPLHTVLAELGFELQPKNPTDAVEWGMTFSTSDAGLLIKTIKHAGSAHEAGLSAGDVIVAVDGFKATADLSKQLLSRKKAGATSQVLSFRRERLQHHALIWQSAQTQEWTVSVKANTSPLKAPWQ